MVALVHAVKIARAQRAEANQADEAATAELKAYLPFGEELWDREHGIGVLHVQENGQRWVEWANVPADTLRWAVRIGLVTGINSEIYNALLRSDRTPVVRKHLEALKPFVRQGVKDVLRLLEEKRR